MGTAIDHSEVEKLVASFEKSMGGRAIDEGKATAAFKKLLQFADNHGDRNHSISQKEFAALGKDANARTRGELDGLAPFIPAKETNIDQVAAKFKSMLGNFPPPLVTEPAQGTPAKQR